MKVLEELYYGNIKPNFSSFKKDPEYDKAMHTVVETEKKLISLLEGEEKELFIKFANNYAIANGITEEEKFVYGFRLGALLILEVIGGAKEITADGD